jgi:hypothetical protein
MKILSCGEFVPSLGFSVTKGLGLSRWNTVRVGLAWQKRLDLGQRVAIVDVKLEQVTRVMKVVGVYSGPVVDMCLEHAHMNHAVIESGKIGQEASDALLKILRNAYGSMFVTGEKQATVIYLEGN